MDWKCSAVLSRWGMVGIVIGALVADLLWLSDRTDTETWTCFSLHAGPSFSVLSMISDAGHQGNKTSAAHSTNQNGPEQVRKFISLIVFKLLLNYKLSICYLFLQ